MKIKTSKLTDAALDWAVAKCEGKNGVLHDDGITRCIVIAAASGVYKGTWKPSANWSQGGPIIERENIALYPHGDGTYEAEVFLNPKRGAGPSPLIAGMRCYVASKLGDEVEIPSELVS